MRSSKGRPFAVFDIDGTLIRWQLYHAIADALAQRGHIKPQTYQTMREARLNWKKRAGGSFRDYELQVVKVYEATIKTLTRKELELAMDAVFDEYKDQVYTFTREYLKALKSDGYMLLAISGSPTEMVARVAQYYGFLDYVGSEYKYDGQRILGNKTIGAYNKNISLEKLVAKHGLDFKNSVGVGDSYSDVAMLELVEYPIAFNPEKKLFERARDSGWRIVIERKNMVYELESRSGTYQLAKTN